MSGEITTDNLDLYLNNINLILNIESTLTDAMRVAQELTSEMGLIPAFSLSDGTILRYNKHDIRKVIKLTMSENEYICRNKTTQTTNIMSENKSKWIPLIFDEEEGGKGNPVLNSLSVFLVKDKKGRVSTAHVMQPEEDGYNGYLINADCFTIDVDYLTHYQIIEEL